jgi:hypothetical protein
MPIVTWKIMLRRANQDGYHYLATEQRGWAPSVRSRGLADKICGAPGDRQPAEQRTHHYRGSLGVRCPTRLGGAKEHG